MSTLPEMRALVFGVIVATLLALPTATARADGDPASDVLYFQDAFLPYPGPSKAAVNDLAQSLSAAKQRHYVIKVAVIARTTDLGSVPSLFGRPQAYAQFLGQEIRSFYTGPLLVVMRAGFGVWKGGADTTTEKQALESVPLRGGTVDELVRSAAAAVRRLAGVAEKPTATDTRPPRVRALAASAKRGRTTRLRYKVSDDSGRSREVVRVYGKNYFLYASIASPMERARGAVDSVTWRAPTILDETKLRFCVLARDAAGNASKTSCAALRVLS